MSDEFNPDPWEKGPNYIDRTYPSGVARERPKLTTRIHCEPDPDSTEITQSGESMVDRFNRQLRGGHSQNERD